MTTALSCDLQECKHQTVETSGKYIRVRNKLNTPVIIKYPFWKYTKENKNAFYACLNMGEACCPAEIQDRSVCIDGDIAEILMAMKDQE